MEEYAISSEHLEPAAVNSRDLEKYAERRKRQLKFFFKWVAPFLLILASYLLMLITHLITGSWDDTAFSLLIIGVMWLTWSALYTIGRQFSSPKVYRHS